HSGLRQHTIREPTNGGPTHAAPRGPLDCGPRNRSPCCRPPAEGVRSPPAHSCSAQAPPTSRPGGSTMSRIPDAIPARLTGHALRNATLRERSLARAREAPPLARALVTIRARVLGMTRMEFARRSGVSRGSLRDIELGVHTPTRRTLQQFV